MQLFSLFSLAMLAYRLHAAIMQSPCHSIRSPKHTCLVEVDFYDKNGQFTTQQFGLQTSERVPGWYLEKVAKSLWPGMSVANLVVLEET